MKAYVKWSLGIRHKEGEVLMITKAALVQAMAKKYP
jgi:hypothetical protein